MQKSVSPVVTVIVIILVVAAVVFGWFWLTREPSAITPPVEVPGPGADSSARPGSQSRGSGAAPGPSEGPQAPQSADPEAAATGPE